MKTCSNLPARMSIRPSSSLECPQAAKTFMRSSSNCEDEVILELRWGLMRSFSKESPARWRKCPRSHPPKLRRCTHMRSGRWSLPQAPEVSSNRADVDKVNPEL